MPVRKLLKPKHRVPNAEPIEPAGKALSRRKDVVHHIRNLPIYAAMLAGGGAVILMAALTLRYISPFPIADYWWVLKDLFS